MQALWWALSTGVVFHPSKVQLTLTFVSRAARGTTARLETLPEATAEEEARMLIVAEAIVSVVLLTGVHVNLLSECA